jgi:Transglutaminase-like superfamily
MNRGVATWRRFAALPVDERRLVREAAARLSTAWVGLRVMGFQRMRVRAESVRHANHGGDGSAGLAVARMVTRAEESAARHLFFRPNCLVQSLALLRMLRTRGIDAELRLGARNVTGKFEAHAWVELSGVALNDATESGAAFVPFEETGAETPDASVAAMGESAVGGTRKR